MYAQKELNIVTEGEREREIVRSEPYKHLNANILNNRNLNILLGKISQGLTLTCSRTHTYMMHSKPKYIKNKDK